jgi:molecular chaperone GrpE
VDYRKSRSTPSLAAGGATERNAENVIDWKQEIAANYGQWLDQLEESPLTASSPEDADRPPDLYSFFEALCVLRSDVSKGSRRSHETLTRFGITLDGFEQLIREMSHRLKTENQQGDRMSQSALKQFLTPYAQMLERMDRLANKLTDPPQVGLFSTHRKWVSFWTTFEQGFDLLREHFQLLLRDAGVVPMETTGHTFDPVKMKAVAVEQSDAVKHNTVIEELAAGYYLKDEVLKFAEVKIAINKGGQS